MKLSEASWGLHDPEKVHPMQRGKMIFQCAASSGCGFSEPEGKAEIGQQKTFFEIPAIHVFWIRRHGVCLCWWKRQLEARRK